MNPQKTGQFISQLRKERGLTQAQLAEQLHVTSKAVSRWETGKGYPDLTSLEALAAFFHVSIHEVLNGERIEDHQIAAVAERNVTSLLKLTERDRRILCLVLGVFLLVAAYIGIHVAVDLYKCVIGSSNCVIAQDYSQITYYGQTYVPLKTGTLFVRTGEKLVSEASVEGSGFFGKLLFGDMIYSVKGCGTDALIYLQTDYDLVESEVYCRKEQKAYYDSLLQNFRPETYCLEIIQSDWHYGILPAEEALVSLVFENTQELPLDTTAGRSFSRGEGDEMVQVYAYGGDGIFLHTAGTLYWQKGQYFWECQDALYVVPEECAPLLDCYFSYMFQ